MDKTANRIDADRALLRLAGECAHHPGAQLTVARDLLGQRPAEVRCAHPGCGRVLYRAS
jgi:hypothetical protein